MSNLRKCGEKFLNILDKVFNILEIGIIWSMMICISIWGINFLITGTGTMEDSIIVLVVAYTLMISMLIFVPLGLLLVITGISVSIFLFLTEKE